MKKNDLKVALNNLNILLEDMSDANTELIKENIKFKTRVQEKKDTELRRINAINTEKHTEYQKNLYILFKETIDEQRQVIQELSIKSKAAKRSDTSVMG
ncbi:hypothetical protein ACFSQ7_05880 [Paenibacillus rhizoplanae]